MTATPFLGEGATLMSPGLMSINKWICWFGSNWFSSEILRLAVSE